MNKWINIKNKLLELERNNILREEFETLGLKNGHAEINGRNVLMLGSNSYLGLQRDKRLVKSAKDAITKYGIGTGGSRLTCGTFPIHTELERNLASLKKRPAAAVFSTGYMANLGIISSILEPDMIIFSDELNHASIIAGCKLSKAKTIVYKHNDMHDLEKKLKTHKGFPGMVISDAVFSMDGDIADLPELHRLCKEYNLLSMLDEAHSTGTIGPRGFGIEEHYGMYGSVDILMGTLSKALGAQGGFILGSDMLIKYIKSKASSFIFSTSIPAADIAAANRAIYILKEEPERVQQLKQNISTFCSRLSLHGINTQRLTPIIPIIIGSCEKAKKISSHLFDRGFYIPAIRYPSVEMGKARLRISITSDHKPEELQTAADEIYREISCSI